MCPDVSGIKDPAHLPGVSRKARHSENARTEHHVREQIELLDRYLPGYVENYALTLIVIFCENHDREFACFINTTFITC